MKILISNKFYYNRGGDCIYTISLEKLLQKHGHETAIFAMDYPENIQTPWSKYFPRNMSKLMAFTRPFGSNEVETKFNKLLDDFKPDVVHLNNIHTQLSPIIAELAHKRGIKVVWTLHDYKLLCPRYDCLRNSCNICELCFNDDKSYCKTNRCIKGSILASLIGYKEAVMWNRQRLEACTDVFICPSHFMAEKMLQGGFNKNKLVTLWNFIDVNKCKKDEYSKDNYYCYVGRLSHEKGIKTLIESAKELPYKLKIIGGGPLEKELKLQSEKLKANIDFLGYKQWDEIKAIMERAKFSVTPSEWYEVFGLVNIEAQCLGTPILGANIGGIPELIEEGFSGMTFEYKNKDSLKEKIEAMFNTNFDYANIAHKAQEKYNAENYYNQLMKLYK